jgi:hypothetical protein
MVMIRRSRVGLPHGDGNLRGMSPTKPIEEIQAPADSRGHDEFNDLRQAAIRHVAPKAAQRGGHETLIAEATRRRDRAQVVIDAYEPIEPTTPADRELRDKQLSISRDAVRAYGQLISELGQACGSLCVPAQ